MCVLNANVRMKVNIVITVILVQNVNFNCVNTIYFIDVYCVSVQMCIISR